MVKAQLIDWLAVEHGLSKNKMSLIVNDMLNLIANTLASGEKVQLVDFGTFEVKHRAARNVNNPRTGEPMTAPECNYPRFKAGKGFKAIVNI